SGQAARSSSRLGRRSGAATAATSPTRRATSGRWRPVPRAYRSQSDAPAAPAGEGPLLGTVAIVGFPNVGKSTLVNRLTDTGAADVADPTPLTRSIAEQAQAAIDEADLVLFVTDARAGVMPGDEEIAAILRRSRKPVLLLANKIDDPDQDSLALEFHRLGLGDPIPISAVHGYGSGDLLDAIVTMLPGAGPREIGE